MGTMERLAVKPEELDPDWTHWAKCPVTGCGSVTHACCNIHCRDAVMTHLDEEHPGWTIDTERLDASS